MTKKYAVVTGSDGALGIGFVSRLREEGYTVLGITTAECFHGEPLKELLRVPYSIVINNFGVNHLSPIGKTPPEDAAILIANIMTGYRIVDELVRRETPPVVRCLNVASATYRVAQRHTALYCASKAAVVQMTKVMARELAPKWVVNAIAPGRINGTNMTTLTNLQVLEQRGWSAEEADRYALSLIPMGRFTTVSEVVEASWLLLQMPVYVTGIVLDIMGGV